MKNVQFDVILARVVHGNGHFVYYLIYASVAGEMYLHEKHGGEAGEEGDDAVDELGPDETLFALGQKRDG